jgi:nitroimidazol reductase NimA-like FMN-containing flavoprotein (pyridoxamine 5'-phosphate oxidase superfamily)
MSEDIRKKIVDYLGSHNYMAIGTADLDGKPSVHSMGYVSVGPIAYCVTTKDSEKILHIKKNPEVAYVVDEYYAKVFNIKGIQVKGKASLVEDTGELEHAVNLLVKKFPEFAAIGPHPVVVIFKIEPTEGWFIDYSKGVGHRDKVRFDVSR